LTHHSIIPIAASGPSGLRPGRSEADLSSEEEKKLAAQSEQTQKIEAIRTLAGGISHKLDNLLMALQWYASLMRLNIDSSHPHFEKLKVIESYIREEADFIKQLLAFAMDTKHEIKPIDLNELIETTSAIFERTKKGIRIHKKYQKDIWTVEVDREQIEQVLLNLYTNAWEAMPAVGYSIFKPKMLRSMKAMSNPLVCRRAITLSYQLLTSESAWMR
jgi:signal transduction histidine kinase